MGDGPRWSRPRPFVLDHLSGTIEVFPATRSVRGDVVLRLRRVDPAATHVALDANDFEIRSVEVGGRPVTVDNDGRAIRVPVESEQAEVRVVYEARPRRGLYFVTARDPLEPVDPSAPVTEVWSQGQDEDNRCWLPLLDHPGERLTTELTFDVPGAWFALSNGVLLDRAQHGDRARYRWQQTEPHPPYLITLATGRFDECHELHGALPVDYYVPPGRGADIPRSLGRTPRMIALFEERFRTPFPWAKYAQVVVHDFIFGGMENTSATTLYDRALLDERAALDVDMDSLVAHELAHQWFGDLVTCRDWSHAWLNEGFATFCEHLWREHAEGDDAYLLGLEHDLEAYLDEDRDRYRRPIVTNLWSAPIDIFDRHLYQKGGLVLHTLRRHLGDDAFFRGVAHYLAKHRGRPAETRDFHRALEEATGRSLDAFFDQWIFRAGHPALEVSVELDGPLARVTVVQSQAKPSEASTLFQFRLPIALVSDAGEDLVEVEVSRARETFTLRARANPRLVVVDPRTELLCTIELKLSTSLLVEQLQHATTAQPRWRAAHALGKKNEPRATRALVEALRSDAFWGVRAEAASALGEQRSSDALDALVASSEQESDARVRRAIASALGRFDAALDTTTRLGGRAADALLDWMQRGDRSYLVESELRRSLGRTRDPRALATLRDAFANDAVSWNESVRQGALDGLGALRDAAVLPVVEAALRPEHAASVRRSAMSILGRARLWTSDEPTLARVRDAIVRGFDTLDPGVRIAGARALAALRDPAGAPHIQRLIDRDLDGRVRRGAREALRDLRDRTSRGRENTQLRDELEKVQRELRDLRERIAGLDPKR